MITRENMKECLELQTQITVLEVLFGEKNKKLEELREECRKP